MSTRYECPKCGHIQDTDSACEECTRKIEEANMKVHMKGLEMVYSHLKNKITDKYTCCGCTDGQFRRFSRILGSISIILGIIFVLFHIGDGDFQTGPFCIMLGAILWFLSVFAEEDDD